MATIPQEAQDLINSWIGPQTIVSTIKIYPDKIISVSKEYDKYHVFSCFIIGGAWNLCVDASDITADEAFAVLGKIIF